MHKLIITPGDIDGIGLEITAKSILKLKNKSKIGVLIWIHPEAEKKWRLVLKKIPKSKWTSNVSEAFQFLKKGNWVFLESNQSPAQWVETSAQACMADRSLALVTGPLSKTGIHEAGFADKGHTDILKRVCKAPSVNMGFVGEKFNVVLATDHMPLNEVPTRLTFDTLRSAIFNANQFFRAGNKKAPPIALLGLNPHAGENGLLGLEEKNLFSIVLKWCESNQIPVIGPIAPDAAFLPSKWKYYSAYVCCYHDQGLIPFKTIHATKAVHVSLGLPIIRTSVDHGTAKEIFGKNKADFLSMKMAIDSALKLQKGAKYAR